MGGKRTFAATTRILPANDDQNVAESLSALAERLAKLNLEVGWSAVMLPAEASHPLGAMKLVDERLFVH